MNYIDEMDLDRWAQPQPLSAITINSDHITKITITQNIWTELHGTYQNYDVSCLHVKGTLIKVIDEMYLERFVDQKKLVYSNQVNIITINTAYF